MSTAATVSIKEYKFPMTVPEDFCYLYNSEKYKYAVVCIDGREFKKIKLKKSPGGYDKLYVHIVNILRNALDIAKEKYQSHEYIVYVDMANTSMKQFDLTFAKTLIVILESTFQDTLKYCIIKNAPKLFKIIYRLIYPFIDKITRNKFMFEKNGKIKKIDINEFMSS